MTQVRFGGAWRYSVAVAALVVALAGVPGCAAGPAAQAGAVTPKSPASFVSTAPEDQCTAFACEE